MTLQNELEGGSQEQRGMEELVEADLARQIAEKSIEVSRWRARSEILELRLVAAEGRVEQLEVLAGVLEAQVTTETQDSKSEDVEGEESPTKG